MDLVRIFKFFVFIISFVMFCYQLNIATINLMDPPTVLSQYERDATEDDMPLVTFCPTNQIDSTRMRELGYFSYDFILMGYAKCSKSTFCTSWGAHANLSFDELINHVFDLKKVNGLEIRGGKFKAGTVFLPGYGLCKETSLPNYTKEVSLLHYNPEDARVFITDRNYRSFFMPDVTSHIGSKIFLKPDTEHYINVKIQKRHTCKNEEKVMSQENFKKCVTDRILNEFQQNNITCVPPWLSDKRKCDLTYPTEIYDKFKNDFLKKYIQKVGIFRNIWVEDECRQSCKESSYIVEGDDSKIVSYGNIAYLTFDQKVIVTERVPNYDMFKYIIDVGSSLGLWLGLSVLGLHDLVVWAVQFINNSFIFKKIRSAVTK